MTSIAVPAVAAIDKEPVATCVEALKAENLAGLDVVVFEKSPNPGAAAVEPARLARGGVRADIGLDRLIEPIEDNLDAAALSASVLLGRANAILGKKIVMPMDVQMAIAQIARSHG